MKSIVSILVAGLMAAPSLSVAAPLGLGDTIGLFGTTSFAQPELAGTVVSDEVELQTIAPDPAVWFSQIGTSLQKRVVESDVDGTLIFGPRIISTFNISFNQFQIDRLVISGFGTFDIDAAYRTDGLGDRGPTSASRSADGDTLTFDFGFPLIVSNLNPLPQEDSYFLSLNTDATAFSLDGRASVFARHLGFPGETFRFDFDDVPVPISVPAVPLPSSMLLLLGALGIGRCLTMRKA